MILVQIVFFVGKIASLNDDEVFELLNGDLSDVEEFNEGLDVNFEIFDEILLGFLDIIEVMHLYIFSDIIYCINIYIGLKYLKLK